jgi:hypothetical protein
MNPEWSAAERAKQVRDEARGWRRAGFVNDEVLRRTLSLFPDDRQRFGPGFRALAFLFAGFACIVMVGLALVLFEPRGELGLGVQLCFWAMVLAGLTELQRGPWKRADAGAESATAYASVILGVLGLVALTESFPTDARVFETATRALAILFVACVVAAWRYGDAVLFALGALSGFALLVQTGHGRILWILVGAFLVPACLRAARDARFSPSHRRGAAIAGAAAIVALYAAVHVWSFDQRLLEWTHDFNLSPAVVSFRWLSILATALLPPFLLGLGWRRREPLLLYSGLLLIGVSIATIRLYHSVLPLSFALILIGAACLALALGVRRWLRGGEQGERDGFTADPLFDDANRTEAIRAVVAVASFTPAAQPTVSRPAFEGGGGSFGGGGATGGF